MVFRVFTGFWNHHWNQFYDILVRLKRNLWFIGSHSPFLPQTLLPQAATNLLLDVPTPDIFLWMESHAMWSFVTGFSMHVFDVYLRYNLCQNFIPFCCWVIFHCTDLLHLVHQLMGMWVDSSYWTFPCRPLCEHTFHFSGFGRHVGGNCWVLG